MKLKISQILAKTRLKKADHAFYQKQVDGCHFCAMGVLALKSGLVPRKRLIETPGMVHGYINRILEKFGVTCDDKYEPINCPLCGVPKEKGYLIAHLNNSDGHNLSFKDMGKVLAEMGW